MTNTVEPITDEERQSVIADAQKSVNEPLLVNTGYAAGSYPAYVLRYEARLSATEEENKRLREALKAADKLCNEALPKFNWGKSALDANAIRLLNEVPGMIRNALNKGKDDDRPG